ncbi:MAG TPA: response regulator [Candidatus Kapabacteria bacterium]|nr:response regulator [Candidatus Kapabacteria bacterium]
MIRCITVDDEPLARARLRMLLADAAEPVEVAAEASSGREALELVQRLRPDLVFLDVSMPGLDGFDVAELMTPHRPLIVFVTAHDEHALRAFDVQAIGYLTKPVRPAALERTLQQAKRFIDAAGETGPTDAKGVPLARIAVHQGRRLRIVPVEAIRWLESRDRVVYARLDDGEHAIDFTLDELEVRLDPAAFLRIHRSYIVSTRAIRELVPWFAGAAVVRLDDGTQLPVARRRIRVVRGVLGG